MAVEEADLLAAVEKPAAPAAPGVAVEEGDEIDVVRGAQDVVKNAVAIVNTLRATKDGHKTTEFYLTLMAQLVGALSVSGILTKEVAGIIAGTSLAVIMSVFYLYQRTLLKREQVQAVSAAVEASK